MYGQAKEAYVKHSEIIKKLKAQWSSKKPRSVVATKTARENPAIYTAARPALNTSMGSEGTATDKDVIQATARPSVEAFPWENRELESTMFNDGEF